MAIGEGGGGSSDTGGGGYSGDTPRQIGSSLPGMLPGESMDDYWKRLGAGPGEGDPFPWLTGASEIADSPWLMGLPQTITGAFQSPQGPGGGIADVFGINPLGNGENLPPYLQDYLGKLKQQGGSGSGDFAFPYQTQSPGTPQTQGLEPGVGFMQDVDMTKQGAAEKYFKDFGEGFTGPTMSQGFAANTFNKFGENQPGVTQNAGAAYGKIEGAGMPGNVQGVFDETRTGVPAAEGRGALQDFRANVSANMDPYYADASRKAGERIDRSFGARGMYGSSAALDARREMETELAGQQAKEEAQYGLQRAGLGGTLAGQVDSTALARSGLLGTLGGSADAATQARLGLMSSAGSAADASSQAASQNLQGWQRTLSDLFNTTDQGRVAALTAGMGAAGSAQDMQRRRGQDAFGNEMAMGNAMSGTMGSAYDAMIGRDQTALNDVISLYTGAGAEKYGQATDAANRSSTSFDNMMNTFGNTYKAATGMTGGGGGSNPGGSTPTPPAAPGGAGAYGTLNPGGELPNYYQY